MLKQQATSELLSQGYTVQVEYRVKIAEKHFIVDVVGFKGKESVAIECGRTKHSKIEELKTFFTQVYRLYYTCSLNPRRETRKRRIRQFFTYATSRLFQRGKTQVPAVVREILKLKDDDKIVWVEEERGQIMVVKGYTLRRS